MKLRRHYFTLLELSAVIVILILLTAISTVYIRRDRKNYEFEQALRDFQAFCARARTAVMRDGKVRKIVFYPDERVFRIEFVESWNESGAIAKVEDVEGNTANFVVLDAVDPDADESADEVEDESIGEKFRSWSFPEKLGMNFDMPDFEGVEINENEIELWRYTPGGSARLQHALKVSLNEDTRLITVSDFTGLLEIRKDIPDEGRILY